MSKAAISRSNIARPTVASTYCRHWRTPWWPTPRPRSSRSPRQRRWPPGRNRNHSDRFRGRRRPGRTRSRFQFQSSRRQCHGRNFRRHLARGKTARTRRELVPSATLVGSTINPGNPTSESQTTDTQVAARALGVELLVLNASSEPNIDAAFARSVQQRAMPWSSAPIYRLSVDVINW